MPAPGERKGAKFPFQPGEDSFPQWNHGFSVIIDDLRALLFTAKGEVPLKPHVGTSVNAFVFENPTPITQALVAREIRQIVATHFPEMRVTNVITRIETQGPAKIIVVKLVYTISGQEGEEEIPLEL